MPQYKYSIFFQVLSQASPELIHSSPLPSPDYAQTQT